MEPQTCGSSSGQSGCITDFPHQYPRAFAPPKLLAVTRAGNATRRAQKGRTRIVASGNLDPDGKRVQIPHKNQYVYAVTSGQNPGLGLTFRRSTARHLGGSLDAEQGPLLGRFTVTTVPPPRGLWTNIPTTITTAASLLLLEGIPDGRFSCHFPSGSLVPVQNLYLPDSLL